MTNKLISGKVNYFELFPNIFKLQSSRGKIQS